MSNRRALAFLVIVVLIGCSRSVERPIPSRDGSEEPSVRPPEAIDGQPLATLYELGDRLARTICPDAQVATESVSNQHMPGQVDRLETRECATGTATIYRGATTSDPDGFALALEIRLAGSGLPSYMEIGQPIDEAIRALGEPQTRDPEAATFGLGYEGIDTVAIRHKAGRIVSVEWTWVLD